MKYFEWYWREIFVEPNRSPRERIGIAGIFLAMFGLCAAGIINGINIYYDHPFYDNPVAFLTIDIGFLAAQRFFMRMSLKAQAIRLRAEVERDTATRLTLRVLGNGLTYWAATTENGTTTAIYRADQAEDAS